MRPSLAAFLAGSCLLVLAPIAGRAADVPYGVTVDGRRLDAHGRSGRNHNGVAYINVVRAVKAFGGLLTFGHDGIVRVSIDDRTLTYRVGRATALLDNATVVKLRGAPYLASGDTYVPVVSIATLAMATYTIDTRAHRINLQLGRTAGFAPVAGGTPEAGEDDVSLSPLQALSLKPSATTDADGLHARVEVTNVTQKPYSIAFPGPQQFVFVVARNGSEVWTSQSEAISGGPSMFTLQPGEATTFRQDWPGYLKAGAGRYTLRVRMLKSVPIDTPPVSLGVSTPGPSPSS
jgi:hypothetical protein